MPGEFIDGPGLTFVLIAVSYVGHVMTRAYCEGF